MTLQLKKFDMKSISFKPDENKGPVVVLIGRRDTGKSFLVRDLLLFHHQDIPIGTVISGTEAGNGFYSLRMFPSCLFMKNTMYGVGGKCITSAKSGAKTNEQRKRTTINRINDRSKNVCHT